MAKGKCDFKPCLAVASLKIEKSNGVRERELCADCFYKINKLSQKFRDQIKEDNINRKTIRWLKNNSKNV